MGDTSVISNYKIISWEVAKDHLRDGDIALFRGAGIVSFFIRRASQGHYSHVGVISGYGYNGHRVWECVEFLEYKGGRTINLDRYIKSYEGSIDIFRPSRKKNIIIYDQENDQIIDKNIPLDAQGVINTMRKMTGLPYGWKRIWWLFQRKAPFLRIIYPIDSVVDDNIKEPVYPVCSTAIAYSFSKQGYDVVHHRADDYTEPSDLARSALLHYLFTIKK